MAVYNEIGIGRWNRFIQKLCDMKGGPPARQLSSEIAFSHMIFHGAENRYLESWNRNGLAVALAAPGAGNVAGLQLRNPVGSNVIAVIEKAHVGVPIADQPAFRLGGLISVDGPTIQTPQTFDNRVSGPGNPVITSLILSSSSGAASLAPQGNIICNPNLPATSNYDMILDAVQELTLTPGACFQIRSNVLNQAIQCSIFWRERFLEPAERF